MTARSAGRRRAAGAPLALLLVSLTACSLARCDNGLAPAVMETLYFGSKKPDKTFVTAEEWKAFVDEVISPRFPQGFTSWTAGGQWRNQRGEIEKENSWVVRIVYEPNDRSASLIDVISDEYRRRFEQEAVLRTREQTCITFR